MDPERFRSLWRSVEAIGRDPATGGYLRYAWSEAELACREWFAEEATDRDLMVETDGNGNCWAWWGDPAQGGAVVTGSHFDSVPHGGGYDGPLGIVSGFLALDLLREQAAQPVRPVGIVAFAEEEGSRFGVACLGSRLLTGALDPDRARSLVDRDGLRLEQVLATAGVDPAAVGADGVRVGALAAFVELHIEQGRWLARQDQPVGVATAIWPHGRWRLEFTGEANHAGTTAMDDRRDPMLTFADAVLAADEQARLAGGRATVGRIAVEPNATNAIAATVTAWLDARGPDEETLNQIVDALTARMTARSGQDGTTLAVTSESRTPVTEFDRGLRDRVCAVLPDAPLLPTGAGHDAGVLANAGVPTAMIFVRNPTGVSHAPAERATDVDCAAGVVALAGVLAELACRR